MEPPAKRMKETTVNNPISEKDEDEMNEMTDSHKKRQKDVKKTTFEEQDEKEAKPVAKRDFYRSIEASLIRISKERKKLVENLNEGCSKYNEDGFMYKLSKRYMKMFNVRDLLLTVSASDYENYDENENEEPEVEKGGNEDRTIETDVDISVVDEAALVDNYSSTDSSSIKFLTSDDEDDNDGDDDEVKKRALIEELKVQVPESVEEPGPSIEKDMKSDIPPTTQKSTKKTARKKVATRTMEKITRELDTNPVADTEKQSTQENKLSTDEMMVTDELFSMLGDPMEFVFETSLGVVTIRDNMQTLAPTLKIEANVIDSFASVLNYEKNLNNKGVRMKHYFYTAMISKDMIEGKMKDEKKQIQAFHESMESVFKKNEINMTMQHIELAFFPIIAHQHFYLVVFNLFKGTSVIIDNRKSGQTYDSKYKNVCDLLKKLFSKHLERYKHPRALDVMDKKTNIMKLKWGTKNNVVDCGVFMMMHMENYNGEAASKWNFVFPTETEGQTMELIKMRIKYATKMLMHEINLHRQMMIEHAHQFARENTDKEKKQQMIEDNIKKKKDQQDAIHVPSAL